MATYVIGDVHGWKPGLDALLAELRPDPERDRLWLVGDLVNRGPDSLGVLRWARETAERWGERFVNVLGNHDLHLLAMGEGLKKPNEDLAPILDAPDREPLLAWLRHRSFLHRQTLENGAGGAIDVVMIHAGLRPSWTLTEAETWAGRLEDRLRSSEGSEILKGRAHLREGPEPARPLANALHAFVTLRTCSDEGYPCSHKGPPDTAPEGCLPWFDVPEAAWRGEADRVIFGHWAALRLYRGEGVIGLDDGAAWGGPLTALCLEDDRIVQVPRDG